MKIYSFVTKTPTVEFLRDLEDIESLKSVKIMKKGHNIHGPQWLNKEVYYGIMFCVMDEKDKLYLKLKYGNLLNE